MYRWIIGRTMRALVPRVVGGKTWLIRYVFADDAVFVFPGRHSWAGRFQSRAAIKDWVSRFAALRPDYHVLDVVVGGPPWRTRAVVRFADRIGADYANEGVQFIRLRWGRVVEEHVYLDTQAIVEWEARLPSGPYGPGAGSVSVAARAG